MAKNSDGDLALQWVEKHGQAFRYVPQWDYWLRWTNLLWERDWDEATVTCAAVQQFDESLHRCETILRLSRKHPDVAVGPDRFDTCALMLNTPSGSCDCGEMLKGA